MPENPETLPIIRTVSELRAVVRGWRLQGLSVGLVPTMGALHAGHLTLVEEAKRRADRVVTSVFVNPTQFAAHEDLGTYPRQEAQDAALLTAAGGAVMFAPTVAEMYPAGFVTSVAVGDAARGGPSQGLEGEFRPAMFGGVAVVVSKLLNQVQADVAVFGEKDWQQLMVVRRMAADLDIPTEIVGSPTLRDDHGLALSSRNAYLSEAELAVARKLNVILRQAADQAAAKRPLAAVERDAYGAILKAGFDRVDYVVIRHADDLTPFAEGVVTGPARILVAAAIGRTRLIDNMAV
ncbi:pantoate--beta-alanine ligase [Brevundimonas goettingensis]|uniref:Pantothenate synthetase n=1 Tax=Brevundimonas goettingensis TaxID=2774190 RepID=A0A975GXU9_9CAUL|nr:pantoate--beta-alanine ligase [Brevundimonas goettingensis]QTC93293.1 pantoate--beta-alanine ligase [Brevundimonas goettingensis]